ncbi:LETM1-related biofilm-associated protein [Flavobacterium sp. ASW18X]|uniref:LETM1-related biofilm-associated protein n=1 Tax=Flavobacterium sp. ASW18X TaxID=2572595 RepID=UPI0010AE8AFB|nr:LETM1-related biofilm-associated protein [Flavobacterium sp. ASW18X]TKD62574.1 hypothetical protein FBT53_10085 [Flavobacterium sp. ASW18X]
MNPSATGWIKKFGHLIQEKQELYVDQNHLYQVLLANGFVYGIHLTPPPFAVAEHSYTEDEIAKINLLTALYFSYKFETQKTDFSHFVSMVFEYYKLMNLGQIGFLDKILIGKKTEDQLEKLLDSRIYLNGSAFSRAFGNSLTNSLLYVDVLIFKEFLRGNPDIKSHAELLEYVTINIAYQALNSKETRKSDEKLLEILAASLSYVDLNETHFEHSFHELLSLKFSESEKKYLLDIACLTVWEDGKLEQEESDFIYEVGYGLNWDKNTIAEAVKNVLIFFDENREKIPYLKELNMASQFYDGMTKNVSKLILRNSKRLKKELVESKELLQLLAKSTKQDLTPQERKKMQQQLLDLFKSIPSLAIFMLPGGAVLLPIFIKLIPQLLPSAFDDNRIEE